MNLRAIKAIYRFELIRSTRTLVPTIVVPVISTSLYFVVFGSAIGSQMAEVDGIGYGAYIIPGLLMLTVMIESVSNGSFAIFMPRFSGMIFEVLSAPISAFDMVIGYVGASATKATVIGAVIIATSRCFVDFTIAHPFGLFGFLVLTTVTFSLLGFLIGLWAEGFEQLNIVPMLVITPLTFLGGCFYSIGMLPPLWQKLSLFNPVVYLVSGCRWSFFGTADIGIVTSLAMTGVVLAVGMALVAWILRTGYRLKS